MVPWGTFSERWLAYVWMDGSVTQGTSGLEMGISGTVGGWLGKQRQNGSYPYMPLWPGLLCSEQPAQPRVVTQNLHFITREMKSWERGGLPRTSLQERALQNNLLGRGEGDFERIVRDRRNLGGGNVIKSKGGKIVREGQSETY